MLSRWLLMYGMYRGGLTHWFVSFLARIRKPAYEEGVVKVSGVEIDDDNEDFDDDDSGNSFRLKLARTPLSTSFAVFDTSLTLIADPNFAEESISEGQISITIDEQGQLCAVTKVGAATTSQAVLRQCVDRARERSQELRALMNQ